VLLPELAFDRLHLPFLATTHCHPLPVHCLILLHIPSSCRMNCLPIPMARNQQFTIGWISPLPLEKETARPVLDEEYPQDEVQYQSSFYLGGPVGEHKVVIGVQRGMGLSHAAILTEKVRGVPGDLIAAVNDFGSEGQSKTNISEVLKQMHRKLDEKRQHQYNDPGPTHDRLFEDGYEH
jgi:hypothetical protein